MMDTLRILLLVMLALPLAAAVVSGLLGPRRGPAIRWVCLLSAVVCLALSLLLAVSFARLRYGDRAQEPPAAAEQTFRPEIVPGDPGRTHATTWNLLSVGRGSPIQLYLGIDGLNVWLIVLTTLLLFTSVLVSWRAIDERVNEFYAWLMALGTAMLGVFLSFDVILFYVFFELTLVPLFFLIGIWGGPQRQYAARKFFIYTLTGSLITLLGILAVVLIVQQQPETDVLTFSMPELVKQVHVLQAGAGSEPWRHAQIWIFLALMAGFAIKVPLVPLHTWLPLAHVEAPTAGSVLLAGVLLKVGTYGFLRLCVPLTPDASVSLGIPLIGTLAVIGIVYGSLCALAQEDIKRMVAYSSVAHLGFCMLGMFALNRAGLTGSVMQMINHGLSTGGLFLLVGMLYERYHTRKMADYGGMAARLKIMACFWVFIVLTSIGLPGLNGFIGEALVLFGAYEMQYVEFWQSPVLAIIASSGIILGAWYLLTLLRRVFFGPVKEPHHEGHGPVGDLNGRELAALLPVAAACVFIGVYAQPVINAMEPDLNVVAQIAGQAKEQAKIRQAQAEEAARAPTAPGVR
ncbi:MAG TPA: NADH-quinone oxidoreductase subunit M [Gemmataceae bacterium]|nr:NADH-quinone oxidoreductase subunit M [Gemmataceae bacterium]